MHYRIVSTDTPRWARTATGRAMTFMGMAALFSASVGSETAQCDSRQVENVAILSITGNNLGTLDVGTATECATGEFGYLVPVSSSAPLAESSSPATGSPNARHVQTSVSRSAACCQNQHGLIPDTQTCSGWTFTPSTRKQCSKHGCCFLKSGPPDVINQHLSHDVGFTSGCIGACTPDDRLPALTPALTFHV